jgi:hypothetical protein
MKFKSIILPTVTAEHPIVYEIYIILSTVAGFKLGTCTP